MVHQVFSWPWVEAQVAQTVAVWNGSPASSTPLSSLQGRSRYGLPRYSCDEQHNREKVYDEGLQAVERELRRVPTTEAARIQTQERIVASFGRFSASALGLDGQAVTLLTEDFLPVGTKLARWAREFDAGLSMPDIIQACRNAWTACGLQPLLGERVALTPAILAYSLLYPYSDNYLDREDLSAEAKLHFSERFRYRLRGERLAAQDEREAALWALVELIEGQYPRAQFPQVFDGLLAIHRAQEESIAQVGARCDDTELLRVSCAKGGTSVLADACLARGWLDEQEGRFAFEWGVLLQLGDDLQDVREDLRRGSVTLFSRAAAMGVPLDGFTVQLLNFSEHVAARMDQLPHGTTTLKDLLRMSWRSLIIRAVADSHEFFTPGFLEEAERCSPFHFEFLRSRNKRLAGRQGLYAALFEALIEAREGETHEGDGLPLPHFEGVA